LGLRVRAKSSFVFALKCVSGEAIGIGKDGCAPARVVWLESEAKKALRLADVGGIDMS